MPTPVALVALDKDLLDLLGMLRDIALVGVIDRDPACDAGGLPWLGADEDWETVAALHPGLKPAISLDRPARRRDLAGPMEADLSFLSPRAYVAASATVGAGSILQHGVTVMTDAVVGRCCKLNINATLHHDVVVGDFSVLAPGCQLLGGVTVEAEAFVGAGAVVLPRVRIGEGAVVGAGAVVTRDVAPAATVAGVPARLR